METALRLVVTNAAAAAVVAVVALVVSRVVRRPALAHALWLLSLVKLLTPPLLPLPLLPAWDPAPAQAARSADDSRRALEARRRELDARRRSLQRQELELQQQELALNARAEHVELRAAAERLRAEGHARQAELYEKQLAISGRQADLQRRRLMHDAERMAIEAGLDAEVRDEEMRHLATEQIEREIKRLEAALAALNAGAARRQPPP